SNSWISLYGDGELEEHLEFLHTRYLSRFTRIDPGPEIPLQRPFDSQREMSVPYAILPHEEERDRTYLSMNFAVGTAADPVLALAGTVLEHLLLETPAAPLKKALIDAGIGKDVFGQLERDLLQPVLSVVAKNTGRDRAAGFQETVTGTLERLADGGIERRLKEASINIHEFRLREADFRGLPRGLVYCWSALGSWLYEGDPFAHLFFERSLREIRKALTSDFFERLIRERLLENRHRSLLTVYPEKGLLERRERKLREELDHRRRTLSEKDVEELIGQTRRLKERQATPDPPELLEKIPLLSLQDIDRRAERLPLEERTESGLPVLFHPVFTSGIAYVHLLLDSTGVPPEDLPYLSLLARVLGKTGTEKLEYGELANEINLHTGGISFGNEAFGDKDDDRSYLPRMMVRSKVLVGKLPRLWDILGELLAATRFDDRKRIREIVQESISRYEMSLYDQGHMLAAGRLLSSFSPRGCYQELTGGISFLHFLRKVDRELDERFDQVSERLARTMQRVAARGNLTVSLTADAADYDRFRETLPAFLERLPGGTPRRYRYRLEQGARSEALLTPGAVQYIAKGYNFRSTGFGYRGSLQVLRTVASLDYLWNRVRVQGGAYGCFARFSRNGTAYFCSYRDPNLEETLTVYDRAAGYFRELRASAREITKYIIGTVSRMDHPLTPSMKGEVSDRRWLQNVTHQDVQQEREEVLATRLEHIREAADLIEAVMGKNHICVMGGEQALRARSHLFDRMVNVF
ncbi:MAG: insulinase family protein, partial [Spirochaetota bacterium]